MTETIRSGPGLSHLMIWERQFRQLVEFRRTHGHCQVPAGGGPRVPLAGWVARQRRLSQAGLLERERRAQLAELGFDWDRQQEDWDEMFERLAAYERARGDCLVPVRWPDDAALAGWVRFQRALRRAGRLAESRARQIEKINFCWEPRHLAAARDPVPAVRPLTWDERFAQLLAFRRAYGHCRIPISWPVNLTLGRWVTVQRRMRRQQVLDPGHQRQLDEVGFVWSARAARFHNPDFDGSEADRWERRFAQLQRFRERFGHARVPEHWAEDRRFANWVGRQRTLKKKSRLTPERQERLEALGFAWSDPRPVDVIHEARWERQLQRLLAFRERHGHCRVPSTWQEDASLAAWVVNQRVIHGSGLLSAERIARLEEAGFLWDGDEGLEADWEAEWNANFALLVQWQERHGHLRVTLRQQPQLFRWTHTQRQMRRDGTLRPDRVARLDALGFLWDRGALQTVRPAPRPEVEARWQQRLEQCERFRERFGHGNIPQGWPEDRELASWAHNQRGRKARGQLSPERLARLDAIGFAWKGNQAQSPRNAAVWEQRYAELVRFQATHGHCRPNAYKSQRDEKVLAEWVAGQRSARRKGKLLPDRQARLDRLGFKW